MLNLFRIDVSYRDPRYPDRRIDTFEVWDKNSQGAMYQVKHYVLDKIPDLAERLPTLRVENIQVWRNGKFHNMIEDDYKED